MDPAGAGVHTWFSDDVTGFAAHRVRPMRNPNNFLRRLNISRRPMVFLIDRHKIRRERARYIIRLGA